MNLSIIKKVGLPVLLSCSASGAYAENAVGGVSLGATRVIYPLEAKQISLPVINHSKKDRFLINSWVETADEKKTKDVLITPPLFVAEPGTENTLRIVNLAGQLPQDRESVYWINVKAIPSIDKDALIDKNILQLAVLSRIKLFIRPKNLTMKPETALEKITFSKLGDSIQVNNPSPYHVSFVNVYVDGVRVANAMAAPLTQTKITNVAGKKISYQTVNDFGGLTAKVDLNLD